jgi:hypothetical protein
MKKLPVKFGNVSYDFSCNGNELTTLEGCPSYVGGGFHCGGNELTTLKGCPKYVGNSFYCGSNNLTTLESCPKYIGNNLWCDIITHHILGNIKGKILYNKQRIVI